MTDPEECCGKVLVAHRDAMDKVDVFDGQARCSVFAVHPPAALRFVPRGSSWQLDGRSHGNAVHPLRSLAATAGSRSDTPNRPEAGARFESFDPYPGQQQETTLIYDQLQIAHSLLRVPADPLIACRHLPSG